eukprot:CAMPEP_0113871364 /NCGR_PEP_ID=MMETSP0780_2-20120614/2605_1 /TAXON_ID=652834 /ORGANISM="Palpitomonas bilix" /LENGTH=567 /DNA_ID=CAMNT_0000856753 /DNA_START=320 /DNA_END=2023 /DNA_ORIENTATION=+ /assembly_acc=CAM_ASM_000599
MDTSSDLRALFEAFVGAREVNDTLAAFEQLTSAVGSTRYTDIRNELVSVCNYKQKQLFVTLDARFEENARFRTPLKGGDDAGDSEGGEEVKRQTIVIAGAGPCGLRAAIAAVLIGFHVVVLEGRNAFSRHNVLKTWKHTIDDLCLLGFRYFHPKFDVHGTHAVATSDLQMCLLKTGLLIGVDFRYNRWVAGIHESGKKLWTTRSKPSFTEPTTAMEKSGLPSPADGDGEDALAIKPGASIVNSERKNKVDFYEHAHSADGIIRSSIPTDEEGVEVWDFDALIDATGEKTVLSRNLGFDRKIQKYGPAIGMVINLALDPSIPAKQHPPEKVTGIGNLADTTITELANQGIHAENAEYLRGRTHFIALTMLKDAVFKLGILKAEKPTIRESLVRENLDMEALKNTARRIAKCFDLGHCEFAPNNAIQIFDFSARSQLVGTHFLAPFPFFACGDSLASPFWPQGLGVNRGFHSALDAVWGVYLASKRGSRLDYAIGPRTRELTVDDTYVNEERAQAWKLMDFVYFGSHLLSEARTWTIDPLSRYNIRYLTRVQLESTLNDRAKEYVVSQK